MACLLFLFTFGGGSGERVEVEVENGVKEVVGGKLNEVGEEYMEVGGNIGGLGGFDCMVGYCEGEVE